MLFSTATASLLFSTLAMQVAGTYVPLVLRQSGTACDSDDSCKAPCKAPILQCSGVEVTPTAKIQQEALRRFQDAHCVNKKCSCAITSDDQAQKFCEYWLENDKKSFKNARLVKAGLNQDYNVLYCVFEIVHN